MELVKKKLSEIKPYPNNPRINDGAVEAVMESIRQCEYIAPIIVDENGVILAGHTRLKALEKLGRTEAEVVIKSGLTEEQKRKYRLLDNKTDELADWDLDKLAEELEGLNFGDLELDWGVDDPVYDDGFGTDFELPDGDKPEIVTVTIYMHEKQKELFDAVCNSFGEEDFEDFGNPNKSGNVVYEVMKEWAERRKLR